MKILRPVSENEVISEFLKGEYHQTEYQSDRELHEQAVIDPDLNDLQQNSLRRELLFRRHRVTWNELPTQISWSVAQLDADDVHRIRVFPRGHWPKMANGASLSVDDLVASIRLNRFHPSTTEDVTSIQAIAYRLRKKTDSSAVMLIGVNDRDPLTILEGNHRLIAAALVSASKLTDFRCYCGFSPDMHQCFWYDDSRENFVRHAVRRILNQQPKLKASLQHLPLSARLIKGF